MTAGEIKSVVPVYSLSNCIVMGPYAPADALILQAVIDGNGKKKYRVPINDDTQRSVNSIAAAWWPDENLRWVKAISVWKALDEAAETALYSRTCPERVSVTVRGDAHDVAAMRLFATEEDARKRGIYSVEIKRPDQMPLGGAWYVVDISFKRERLSNKTLAEIVMPCSCDKSHSALGVFTLFTDFSSSIGISFSMRLWDGRVRITQGPMSPTGYSLPAM